MAGAAVLARWTIGEGKLILKAEGNLRQRHRQNYEAHTADEAVTATNRFIDEVCMRYLEPQN